MALMITLVRKLLRENPEITAQEVAEQLNLTVEKASIYILWVYYEGEPDDTKKAE